MASTALSMLSILFIFATVLAFQVLGQDSVSDQTSSAESCYCLQKVAEKLHNPLGAIFYQEDKQDLMLVVEQRGVVVRYKIDGSTVSRLDTFMDIRDRVVTSDEFGDSRGLLSVVLGPFYDVTKKVYAYYIRNDTGKEYAYVSRFKVVGGVVDPNSEMFLLRIYQPYKHGNGGPMLFGDDDYLYIVTGDGGLEDDPQDNAQNKNTFHGKVLRIDVDGTQDFTEGESGMAKTYAVPSSNPFVNKDSARPEVYASGIRNMWGCSLDSAKRKSGTGRIYCAETGTNKFDEINIIESGKDYGWNDKEGTVCRNASGCAAIENEGVPVFEIAHNASHSVVGGFVYRGQALTYMVDKGYYTYGDAITGKINYLEESSSNGWLNHDWGICAPNKCPSSAKETALKHILAFSQDLEGELYLLMTDELVSSLAAGKVLKIVPKRLVTIKGCMIRQEGSLIQNYEA